jgi:acetolactate decarboxylase
VNTGGWHFHFLDDARTCGGHVFDMEMKKGRALLNKTDRFIMDLPHNPEFQEAALENASKEEIKGIEQGGE